MGTSNDLNDGFSESPEPDFFDEELPPAEKEAASDSSSQSTAQTLVVRLL